MASEQSPKYAICGNSPARACRIKLETFLKILKAEPNRRPGILNTSFNQGKACNDSTHPDIRERPAMLKMATCRGACHGSTFSSCALSKEPGKGAPRRIFKLLLRLFCEGPYLVVFQPSVDFCSQRQNGNLHWINYHEYLRADLHYSFKRSSGRRKSERRGFDVFYIRGAGSTEGL